MDIVTQFFSYLCGQGRCFIVDGQALPICQRCFGLYVGAALTGGWLLVTGLWKRGLPGRKVIILNLIVLLTAMLGGIHLIDLGPRWRLLCGLWTGHVAILWLAGGASQLYFSLRRTKPGWHRKHHIQAFIILAALTTLGMIFPWLTWPGAIFWIVTVIIGVLILCTTFVAAITAAIRWGVLRWDLIFR